MKRMVGGGLFLGVVAAAAWVASSYWFGVQTEREYHAMMDRSADWQHFKLTDEGYTRGVFRSEARATLVLRAPTAASTQEGEPGQEMPPLTVTLIHDITHGPMPFGVLPDTASIAHPALAVIKTKLTLNPRFKELLNEIRLPDGALPSLDVATVLRWGGDGRTHWVVQPYRGDFGESPRVSVDFSGLKSTIDFSPGFRQFNGSVTMDGFRASIPEAGDLTIKRMGLTFDQHEGVSGFYLGDVSYGLEHLELKHGDPNSAAKDFSLQGGTLRTQAVEVGSDLSSSTVLTLDRVIVGAESYEKAGFEVELRKLDSGALGEFQRALNSARKRTTTAEQASEQSLSALVDFLPKLLKHSPEVEIRQAGFGSASGEIRMGARLWVDGHKIQGALSLPVLLQSAHLEATLSAAEATLVRLLRMMGSREPSEGAAEGLAGSPSRPQTVEEQEADIRDTLAVLTAQRFLVLENGIYRANARFSGGELNINGQAIPLDKLLSP